MLLVSVSSSSFGFWRIKNDDEECGDWPQEKGHNPPIQTASALRLREARVYEGESRPANCILTCFANHHQTPRGIRSPARVLSNPKRRLLQSAGIDYTRNSAKRKISQRTRLLPSQEAPKSLHARRLHGATTQLFAREGPMMSSERRVRDSGRGGACRPQGSRNQRRLPERLQRSPHAGF